MNVYIVGPMGSGKTTVGKMLAQDLGLDFKDVDHELEKRTGADINWIFDVEGEEGLRRRETEVIEVLSQLTGTVVATGGGAANLPENRHLLASRGTVVYLNTPIALQYERTRFSESRPLLRSGDRKEILTRLQEERDPLYREIADMVVDTANKNSRDIVREIVERLN